MEIEGNQRVKYYATEDAERLEIHNKLRDSIVSGDLSTVKSLVEQDFTKYRHEIIAATDLALADCVEGIEDKQVPTFSYLSQIFGEKEMFHTDAIRNIANGDGRYDLAIQAIGDMGRNVVEYYNFWDAVRKDSEVIFDAVMKNKLENIENLFGTKRQAEIQEFQASMLQGTLAIFSREVTGDYHQKFLSTFIEKGLSKEDMVDKAFEAMSSKAKTTLPATSASKTENFIVEHSDAITPAFIKNADYVAAVAKAGSPELLKHFVENGADKAIIEKNASETNKRVLQSLDQYQELAGKLAAKPVAQAQTQTQTTGTGKRKI
ncbi:Uncharacterised protein [Burkholderia pseudomallei]|uniref:hypothetical protein n=1 Tax=Burkholderia pseudomallei TaxID=28450 RepID=UPI0005DAED39|nr:hypothetical protein [Burkholderia pseudomallei]CAK1332611.1 Uncharacterised protein [Burkholderia pseudomallei]